VQPLSASFYQRLITRLQQRLRAEGLQGILLLDMHNVIYLSGFFHSPSERPIGLFIPEAGDPTLFIPLLERDNTDQLFLDDIRSYEEFPGLTHPVLWMLTEINRPHLAIDTLPAQLYTTIQQAFPGICLSDMVSEQRYRKEPEELDFIRTAAYYADRCLDYIFDCAATIIRKGGSERDILQAGVQEAMRELMHDLSDQLTFSHTTVVGTVHSGPRAALPHGKTWQRTPQRGETLIAGIGASVAGYHAESGVTFIIGEMTDDQYHCLKAAQDCNDAAIQALRPGVTGAAINATALNALHQAGLGAFIRHRIGHGMGIQGHEAPWLAPGGETPCAIGMVFSNEPGIYRPNCDGYRTINTMIVTEDVAEVPSTFQARHKLTARVIRL
jgi:Xaa-Pro aminopeptidase